MLRYGRHFCEGMMRKRITVTQETVKSRGQFLTVVERHFIGSHKKRGTWEMVRRNTFGPIVAVAAITSDRKIVLEKSYRIPLKGYALELPAGLADQEGEPSASLARRELLEETGFAIDEVTLLTRGVINQGLCGDVMEVYLGTHARKVQEPKLENAEDISVILVPLDELLTYYRHSDAIPDLKILSVIPLLRERGLIK